MSGYSYFHREFLGQVNDPETDSHVIVSVPKASEYSVGGTIMLCNGYDKVHLNFFHQLEEEKNSQEIVRQAKLLADILTKFAISLEQQVKLFNELSKKEENYEEETGQKPPFPSI